MTTANAVTERPDGPPRQRDRRRGLTDLVSTLARAIGEGADIALVRGAFEEQLRRVVSVRAIRLRDGLSPWRPPASESTDGLESVVFDVPGSHPSAHGILEASLDPGRRIGRVGLSGARHGGAHRRAGARDRPGATAGRPPCRGRGGEAAPRRGRPAHRIDPGHGRRCGRRIERVAATDFTVLLEGESGVGKELVARQIHELSRRRNGPFVAINCAALVETLLEAELFGIEERTATGVRGRRGKFEHADGGTLFLDEVSDLSLSAQAKLLRAIQDLAVERVGGTGTHRVDIRIVAATNRSLAGAGRAAVVPSATCSIGSAASTFACRRCVNGARDILELAHYFLERHRATRPLGLSIAAADALTDYDWPGNVRELERLIERAVALAETDR